MGLLAIRSAINRICGMLIMLGIPCLVIGIILIIRNKSKKSKIRGIVLVCLLPGAYIIQFVSSIIFHNLILNEYKNNHLQQRQIPPSETTLETGQRVNPAKINN